MLSTEVNKRVQDLILKGTDKYIVIGFVKGECRDIQLQPRTLGMLFEMYADMHPDDKDPTTFFSKEITIAELKNIHPGFECTNGCQWARSDNSYLGEKYIIKRPKKNGKVYSIQLDGANKNSIKKFRGVNSAIRKELSQKRCVILDIGNVEIDHKDGHYCELTNINSATQNINDFQPLSKAANDAKRQHCKVCLETGKRFNAKCLGYSEGWVVGDENTKTCAGCYWYDPIRFNQLMSQFFKRVK